MKPPKLELAVCPMCGSPAHAQGYFDDGQQRFLWRVVCDRGAACYHGPPAIDIERAREAWQAHRRDGFHKCQKKI